MAAVVGYSTAIPIESVSDRVTYRPDIRRGTLAIVGYRVRITCDDQVVCDTEAAWPEEDSPNPHLNDVMEAWEADQAETPLGTYVITYEKI
ncbi:hypothetical protein LUX29_09660 [Aureimonas altamirensis]|uniref:hypothetical protein n=1 Tax=Aureimonas altamirensis TaxID=370622 RepID=UPI001E59D083|nr:hypothetical protein [Aureimonas altamirensis]UHD47409.1 hypothetical protein LUX29_09660 [Aureimonas altamirensis]